MFCNQCGNRLENDSMFCGRCGAQISPVEPTPVQPDYDATVCAKTPVQPPVQETPVQQPPVQQPPVQEAPVQQPPVQETPVQQPPVQQPQWSYQPAPQPMQQPQYGYQPPYPQQPYQQPTYQQPYQQQQPWSYVPQPPKKEKKPINKRKLAATIAASLLVLILAAGVLVYFTVFNTPEYQVYSAVNNTIDELREVLGEGKNLVTAVENIKTMSDEGQMHMKVSADGQTIFFDYSRDDEILRAETKMEGVELVIAADEEKLALSLPNKLSNAYSIPLKDFGEKLCNWDMVASQIPSDMRKQLEDLSIDLFSDTSWEEFKDTDAYEEFMDRLVIEESEKRIPNATCDAVYYVKANAEDLVSLLLSYAEFSMKPILGEKLSSAVFGASFAVMKQQLNEECEGISIVLLIGLNDDDCIVAVRGAIEEFGEENGSISIMLAGENNPWERIEAYEDDVLVGTLRIVDNGNGFDAYADDYRFLSCDGERLIFAPDERDPVEVRYSTSGGGCDFSLDVDGMPVEITMSPDVSAKMISGKVIDVFSLSEADLEELGEELEELFG